MPKWPDAIGCQKPLKTLAKYLHFFTCQCVSAAAILARQDSILSAEVNVVVVNNFPKCQKCELGDLVPLSDFGSQGAAIYFKAWACTNPTCGFNIKIRNGDLYIDEPISSGAMHTPRVRA
jgi:hypothetical protein